MMLRSHNAVHSALWLVLNFTAIAVLYVVLNAPFIAMVQITVYAGAIMVLFIFAIMMLNLGKATIEWERQLLSPRVWVLPTVLTLVLAAELIYLLVARKGLPGSGIEQVSPAQIGAELFGPYVLGVEIAAFLLMAGLVGAYHIGRREKKVVHRYLKNEEL